MIWKRNNSGDYAAASGKCRAGVSRDGNQWFWQVTRQGGGTAGGFCASLKQAKAASQHATAHLSRLDVDA